MNLSSCALFMTAIILSDIEKSDERTSTVCRNIPERAALVKAAYANHAGRPVLSCA